MVLKTVEAAAGNLINGRLTLAEAQVHHATGRIINSPAIVIQQRSVSTEIAIP